MYTYNNKNNAQSATDQLKLFSSLLHPYISLLKTIFIYYCIVGIYFTMS